MRLSLLFSLAAVFIGCFFDALGHTEVVPTASPPSVTLPTAALPKAALRRHAALKTDQSIFQTCLNFCMATYHCVRRTVQEAVGIKVEVEEQDREEQGGDDCPSRCWDLLHCDEGFATDRLEGREIKQYKAEFNGTETPVPGGREKMNKIVNAFAQVRRNQIVEADQKRKNEIGPYKKHLGNGFYEWIL